MPEPALRVNRDILFKVFQNHETVVQFENLFNTVDETSNSGGGEEALLLAGDAKAAANSALSLIANLGTNTDTIGNSFETVNENLGAYPKTLSYTGSRLDSVSYTVGASTITKTLTYSGLQLSTVVLSGSTPSGIDLTKTLTYSGLNLTGVAYT